MYRQWDEKLPFCSFTVGGFVEKNWNIRWTFDDNSEEEACGMYIDYALINAVFYYMVLCTFINVYPVKDRYLLLSRILLKLYGTIVLTMVYHNLELVMYCEIRFCFSNQLDQEKS